MCSEHARWSQNTAAALLKYVFTSSLYSWQNAEQDVSNNWHQSVHYMRQWEEKAVSLLTQHCKTIWLPANKWDIWIIHENKLRAESGFLTVVSSRIVNLPSYTLGCDETRITLKYYVGVEVWVVARIQYRSDKEICRYYCSSLTPHSPSIPTQAHHRVTMPEQ